MRMKISGVPIGANSPAQKFPSLSFQGSRRARASLAYGKYKQIRDVIVADGSNSISWTESLPSRIAQIMDWYSHSYILSTF